MYSFCQIKFLNNTNNAVSAVSVSFAVTQLTQEDTMSFLWDTHKIVNIYKLN